MKTPDEIKARRDRICEMRAENPKIEAREIAAILNVNYSTIVSDFAYLRKNGLIARKRAKKTKAANSFAEKKLAKTVTKKTRCAMVCDLYLKNPNLTLREIANRLNFNIFTIKNYLSALRKEGRITSNVASAMMEIEDRVYAVIKKNPNASCREIMNATGFTESRVRSAKKRLQRRGLIEKCSTVNDAMLDEKLEKKRVLRESWYVEEVCGEGFPGMQLPRDCWLRYLALYEKKKSESASVNAYIQNKLNS